MTEIGLFDYHLLHITYVTLIGKFLGMNLFTAKSFSVELMFAHK